jgi:hypothetical protein
MILLAPAGAPRLDCTDPSGTASKCFLKAPAEASVPRVHAQASLANLMGETTKYWTELIGGITNDLDAYSWVFQAFLANQCVSAQIAHRYDRVCILCIFPSPAYAHSHNAIDN